MSTQATIIEEKCPQYDLRINQDLIDGYLNIRITLPQLVYFIDEEYNEAPFRSSDLGYNFL